MTRAAQKTQAVSANQSESMKFLVFEDNGGGYHWTLVSGSGDTLMQSASYASYEEAKQAARIVHGGIASARFEDQAAGAPPIAISARRDAAIARDRLDAERWLDEGGSFKQRGGDTLTGGTLTAPPERLSH